jgi:hypothetical protein
MCQLAIAPAIFALSVPIAFILGPTVGAWTWVTIAVAGPAHGVALSDTSSQPLKVSD